jgi:predicted O-linked N-acetylglucosamine transferase (SPINDLY family)
MLMTLAAAFARASAAESRGDSNAARRIYDDILAGVPEHPGALLGIARQMRRQRDYAGGRAAVDRALQAAEVMGLPKEELWVELGRLEAQVHNRAAARDAYAKALGDRPQYVPALLGAGDAALADGDFDAAEAHFRAALACRESALAPLTGLAQALAGLRRFDEAQTALQEALALAPPNRATCAAAAWVASRMQDWPASEAHCRAGLAIAPKDATLLRLLGSALKSRGAPLEALRAFEDAVAADPDDVWARLGLSAALLDVGRADAARACLDPLLNQGVAHPEIFANLGLAWLMREDYERAATMFERAVDASPGFTPALANLAFSRQHLCAWDGLDDLVSRLAESIDDPDADPRLSPFIALSLPLSSAQQLRVARRWSAATLPRVTAPRVVAARGERLRVGYLSGDFRDHPTGRLMVGLFEAHDRRKVEVFGYSYGAARDSSLRRRIAGAFDHWRDLGSASDRDLAQALRDDRLDVLIDRKGHTHGSRLAALAERPAAVQLHYMSFPGTLGFDAIDGIIADAVVVPPGDEAYYHERIFRLPRCYFVTDGSRALPRPAARADHGLPDNSIVLASLNHTCKITREMFAIWMDALRAAPRAVLWLYASHPAVQANLRAQAAALGVAPERLVFAPNVDQDLHLARLTCADLALDTLPCGSHTTGVDALWAGVPMLTCLGTTFAGRVGASLLGAAGLPELVTTDLAQYREHLLELVADPGQLSAYTAQLDRERSTLPLWDTQGFAADLERLLERAYAEVTSARRAGE